MTKPMAQFKTVPKDFGVFILFSTDITMPIVTNANRTVPKNSGNS